MFSTSDTVANATGGGEELTCLSPLPKTQYLPSDARSTMIRAAQVKRSQLGDYELLESLVGGGVGQTYAARALKGRYIGKRVCLKILAQRYESTRADDYDMREHAIELLKHEAHVCRQLDHPNIVALIDSAEDDGVWYLVFELVEGANLWELLESIPGGAGMWPAHVRSIGFDIAQALQYAHQRDVTHRDIKPGNIMVSTEGVAKLIDFGVAKMDTAHSDVFT